MKPIIVWGAGSLAKMAAFYIKQNKGQVAAFVVDVNHLTNEREFEGVRVISSSDLKQFPSDSFDALVAIGYSHNNTHREKKFNELKAMGYNLASIKAPSAIVPFSVLPENTIVMDQVIIEPWVELGVGNVLWSGSQICHNSKIGNFNFFGPRALICGDVTIGSNNFFGANSTVRDGLTVANSSVVGANTLLSLDLESQVVMTIRGELPFRKGK